MPAVKVAIYLIPAGCSILFFPFTSPAFVLSFRLFGLLSFFPPIHSLKLLRTNDALSCFRCLCRASCIKPCCRYHAVSQLRPLPQKSTIDSCNSISEARAVCPPGMTRVTVGGSCQSCSAGQFSVGGNSPCQTCPAGSSSGGVSLETLVLSLW
jgi:hypothetical protein